MVVPLPLAFFRLSDVAANLNFWVCLYVGKSYSAKGMGLYKKTVGAEDAVPPSGGL